MYRNIYSQIKMDQLFDLLTVRYCERGARTVLLRKDNLKAAKGYAISSFVVDNMGYYYLQLKADDRTLLFEEEHLTPSEWLSALVPVKDFEIDNLDWKEFAELKTGQVQACSFRDWVLSYQRLYKDNPDLIEKFIPLLFEARVSSLRQSDVTIDGLVTKRATHEVKERQGRINQLVSEYGLKRQRYTIEKVPEIIATIPADTAQIRYRQFGSEPQTRIKKPISSADVSDLPGLPESDDESVGSVPGSPVKQVDSETTKRFTILGCTADYISENFSLLSEINSVLEQISVKSKTISEAHAKVVSKYIVLFVKRFVQTIPDSNEDKTKEFVLAYGFQWIDKGSEDATLDFLEMKGMDLTRIDTYRLIALKYGTYLESSLHA